MLEIVILAAGKGTRMRSDRPKVLHKVAGRSLLQHVIDCAYQLNPSRLHIVVGHGSDQVKDSLELNEKLSFVEQKEQLGTGHAVQQVLPFIEDGSDILILYGDVPLISANTLRTLVKYVSNDSMGLLTVVLDDASGYGRIIRNDQGQVTAIVEQKDASKEQLQLREVNTGVMAATGSYLKQCLPTLDNSNAQKEFYLTDIISIARESKIDVYTAQANSACEVLGVNNRRQQAEVERIVQRRLAESLMDDGLTLLDPERFDCRGTLTVGRDCIVDINCVFEGNVVLGDDVKIGPNCYISNSQIGAGTTVHANSIIDESTILGQGNIGPFARLRPGTKLANGVKIGNFVETKKALIGNGSKVNHLSYIGDAKVGADVNIGAGTITCNYDGVNKHITEIGDDVFVGSNTALVAPLTLGAGVTIGAGSVINSSVDEGNLALTRVKQRTVSGWERPKKKAKPK
ncbi:MAG: UDP-N-acetylglucosamine diphosphorylase/glucosamine-1-phosphate N-acetyltransferase [Alteromonadaceae bacterium]|nr:MAG: UDP-N-acetylglucosamine diphosphorylase/glucosamine-1-phosphate N-acetyltransferase [Alteromonadaceae bacterium]